jgi:hypothetical protein
VNKDSYLKKFPRGAFQNGSFQSYELTELNLACYRIDFIFRELVIYKNWLGRGPLSVNEWVSKGCVGVGVSNAASVRRR